MSFPSVAQAVIRGQVSIYLAANYNSRGTLFGGTKAPVSATTIAMITDALDWGNSGGAQTNESLRATANYLIWLCNKWGQAAENITQGAGGGSVVPGGGSSIPDRIDFIVSASSFLPTGTTATNLLTFVGYGLDFVRGGISQSTVITEPSYFTYNRLSGGFTCSPALQVGELIALIPVG